MARCSDIQSCDQKSLQDIVQPYITHRFNNNASPSPPVPNPHECRPYHTPKSKQRPSQTFPSVPTTFPAPGVCGGDSTSSLPPSRPSRSMSFRSTLSANLSVLFSLISSHSPSSRSSFPLPYLLLRGDCKSSKAV